MRVVTIFLGIGLMAVAAWYWWPYYGADLLTITRWTSPTTVESPAGSSVQEGSGTDGLVSAAPLGALDESLTEVIARQTRSKEGSGPTIVGQARHSGGAPGLSEEDAAAEERAAAEESEDDEPVLLPISGWVLDQDGAPVAGIEVTASPRRLADNGDTAGIVGGAGAVFSDESGYFAFSDLSDGEYLLQTRATEVYESAKSIVRTGVSSVVVTVRGDAGVPVTIHGRVTDDEGQPIAGARVAPTDEGQVASSDSGGFYNLVLTVDRESRTRSIRFTKAGYYDQTLGIHQSELSDVTEWPLDAQLQAKGEGVFVEGMVLGANGDPVTGARVRLSSNRLQRSYRDVSAADGSFFMDDVDVGDDYQLWVRPTADYRDHVDEGLQVGSNGAFLPVTLEPLGTGSLRGRMVDAYREPVSRYTLWMWNGGAGANRDLAVTSDSGGGYLVEDVPAGEVTFNSRGNPELNVGGITLESGQTITADLVVDWGHEELTGRVVSSSGDPLAGAKVTLFWSDEEQGVTSRSQRQTVVDGDGYFVFTELGPGPYTVSVTASGYGAARREAMPGDEILIELQERAS